MRQFRSRNRVRDRLQKKLRGCFKIHIAVDQLERVLRACGISYRELARRTNGEVTHVTVSNVAKGKHSPTQRTVDAITRVLMRELNRRYSGELTQDELIELLSVDTERTRKGSLWSQLAEVSGKKSF